MGNHCGSLEETIISPHDFVDLPTHNDVNPIQTGFQFGQRSCSGSSVSSTDSFLDGSAHKVLVTNKCSIKVSNDGCTTKVNEYIFSKKIGKGSFGKVYLCYRREDPNIKYVSTRGTC